MDGGALFGPVGVTPQKPMRKAFEQDPEQVRQWLGEKYPKIRKLAKLKKAEIYWGMRWGCARIMLVVVRMGVVGRRQ